MKNFWFSRWLLVVLTVPALLWANPQVLNIKKMFARSDKSSTSICMTVNKYFSSADEVLAKPYIKILPNDHFDLSLSYDEICLEKLKPATNYQVSINKDIPLGKATLDKDYIQSITTGNYESSLAFKDSGYILPAKGDISIPLETTNIHKVSISLYRINKNNLMSSINEYNLFRQLENYTLKQISEQDGYKLWQRRLTIDNIPNKSVITAVPVGTLLKKIDSGIYILSASPIGEDGEPDKYTIATQWFMVSDIGLYTIQGSDGLRVYVKHLSDATIYNGVKLELRSKNNEVLGRATVKDGEALFDEHLLGGTRGLEMKAIYAYGDNGDFTVLDLGRPAHDLSDRGVNGREASGDLDAFIYSNRGIFRPSETIPVRILLRDQLGKAKPNTKISLRLYDSRQVKVATKLLTTDKSGYAHSTFDIPVSASTGTWNLELYTGAREALAKMKFLVEDFVPPKVTLALMKSPKQILPNQTFVIDTQVNYLTGEPLANADTRAEFIIHASKKPFEKYPDYHFGDIEDIFENSMPDSASSKTDNLGLAHISMKIDADTVMKTSTPLSAHITILASEPGGRLAKTYLEVPYHQRDGYIGIKPNFENNSIDMDAKPSFKIIYLKNLKAKKTKLSYRLIEEDVSWNWISSTKEGMEWEYEKSYSDGRTIFTKDIYSKDNLPTKLILPKLDWGSYRLEIKDNNTDTMSSYRFSSGYEESKSKSSPDRLPISIDKQRYGVNDKVKVNITAKFTGPIMVSIANNKILETKNINAIAGKAIELSFDIKKSWGSSVYVLASAFRAQSKKLGATRAVGVASIAIVDKSKIINLSLDYTKKAHSLSTVSILVHSDNVKSKSSYVTLSAVDEGVLHLTRYDSANPRDYFWGQKRLGIKIRDVYAELIKTMGAHAEFSVGAGDELTAISDDAVVSNKRKVVAIFSDKVKFDSNGDAHITLDIPDYQGALRLMAVAWNDEAVGNSEAKLIIKDPVSTELYMPSFMSVGDRAMVVLRISTDKDIPNSKYKVTLETNGAVKLDENTFAYDTAAHRVWEKKIYMTAKELRDAHIHLEVSNGSKIVSTRDWQMGMRSTYPKSYVRKLGILSSNQTLDNEKASSAKQWENIEHINLHISTKPLIAIKSIENELINYSYRCAEQTTSRALPWLNLPKKNQLNDKIEIVENAIDRLTSQQSMNGGIGLWRSSTPDTWVTSYVIDFLLQAQKAGYEVPQKNIDQGLKWLENNLNHWSKKQAKQEADTYALYVLAKAGRTLMSELDFHISNANSKIRSAQAWGHLASTMSYIGEERKAKELFALAMKSIGVYNGDFYSNYGGTLRDGASLVTLLKESSLDTQANSLYADIALWLKDRKYFSTQELSTLMLASQAIESLSVKNSMLNLMLDGKEFKSKTDFDLKEDDLSRLPNIKNISKYPVWYDMDFIATPNPKANASIENHGFELSKNIYTLDGKLVDKSQIKQNDRLVVVLEGKRLFGKIKQPLVSDWIPAGFELENPIISGIDASDGLAWLGKKSDAKYTEYRNDRYTAVLQMNDKNSSFKLAYIARAVSIGEFALPPAQVKDMYQPRYRAFSRFDDSKLHIKSAKEIAKYQHNLATKSRHLGDPLLSSDYENAYTKPIGDLSTYSILQINFLRNGIFAQAGLDFMASNSMLDKKFSLFGWYRPKEVRSAVIYASLSDLQKDNVQRLLAEEKARAGGLVLHDFYRIHSRVLDRVDLQKYNNSELRILRNSLLARYGLKFRDHTLTEIFDRMPWYHPSNIREDEIYDEMMSEIERRNLQTILNTERNRR